jgi:hypothetical protein
MALAGCNLTGYGPFQKAVIDSDGTSVLNGSHLEFKLDEANKMVVFTGDAIVNFLPSDDNILTRGTLTVLFDYDILDRSNLVAGTASASLASVFNNDTSVSFTYAIDCVDVRGAFIEKVVNGRIFAMPVPSITAAIVVQGAGGHTGLSRVSYQANVQVKLELQLLVAEDTAFTPPDFQREATFVQGNQWLFKVTLPETADTNTPPIAIATDHPLVPPPPVENSITVPVGQASVISNSQSSRVANATAPVDVVVTATFLNLTAKAVLHILPVPH